MECQICQNTENNRSYQIKEMMFGTREEFEYFECDRCGCLQIAQQPKDMAKYYPANYYEPEEKAYQKSKTMSSFVPKIILKTGQIFGSGTGALLAQLYKGPEALASIVRTHTGSNSKILEVGCGKGVLMATLEKWGFKNVVGADLYAVGKIDKDLQICKTSLGSFAQGRFDLIILDHSFEHMPNQLETLEKVFDILTANGICLIRIPIKSDYIWKRYGTNWAQIDAPRHFFIHTLKSFEILANQAGLEIKTTVFDSTSFQFRASEMYTQNIPLKVENSDDQTCASEKMKEYEKMARQFNKEKQGDQAQFYLRKTRKPTNRN
jgi:SAM-dependent methyltransferase